MKIVHLTTHLNMGGVTQYILMLSREMQIRGDKIFLVSSGGLLADTFNRERIEILERSIKTKNELNPRIYLEALSLRVWMKNEHIDILHSHTRVTQVMASVLSRLCRIPHVSTCHGFFKANPGRQLFPCWGDRVIAVSEPVASHLREIHRVNDSKIRVVENGIDIEAIKERFKRYDSMNVRREYGLPLESFVLGSAARLVLDKGQEYLIRALSKLRQDHQRDIHLMIAGEGKDTQRLANLTRELELEDVVHFVGTVTDTAKVFSAIDLFVHVPTWREGFGLALTEAMAVGKPVVISDIWAINTLVKEGINGFVVPASDAQTLADKIAWLMNNPPLLKEVVFNAEKQVRERFSKERMVDGIKKVYQEILS